MKTYIQKQLTRFLVWRYRHINERQFIFGLSDCIGFFAGLVSVTLKECDTLHSTNLYARKHAGYKKSVLFLMPLWS